MKITYKVLGLVAVICLVAFSIHTRKAIGQTPTVVNPSTNAGNPAMMTVSLIREINTAEVGICPSENGQTDQTQKFLTWDELVSAPCFKKAQSYFKGPQFGELSAQSSGNEVAPGIELRLVVSPDGKHYNLWVGQKPREVNCGFAFFSDERGIIFEGKAIGCSEAGVLGK